MQLRSGALVFGLLILPAEGGCSEPSDGSLPITSSGGSGSTAGSGGTASGGASVDTGGTAAGASANLGAGGLGPPSGGTAAGSGGFGVGGDAMLPDGSGGSSSGGQPAGGASMVGTGGNDTGAGGDAPGTGGEAGLEELASALDEFFLHDPCTGEQAQSDTCTHEQKIERRLTLGGDPTATYRVQVRVRGLFEPTHLTGATTPLADHPYFVIGGTVEATDYSQWHIEVEKPHEVYTLNHYPQTSHTIYQEDFEAELIVRGGAEVVVRVLDANDRQIDNATEGLPDRRQLIEGVTDEVLDGQMLRLDVLSVTLDQ